MPVREPFIVQNSNQQIPVREQQTTLQNLLSQSAESLRERKICAAAKEKKKTKPKKERTPVRANSVLKTTSSQPLVTKG